MVKENLARVRERIKDACVRAGRRPEEVKLIVVTKDASLSDIRQAVEEGVRDIGENRVNEAISKKKELASYLLTWHMIGHLQSNKAKAACELFSVIHSVDSIKSAYIINIESGKKKKRQDILIEVNISGEESKFGIKPDELPIFLKETVSMENINVSGLMTIAPFSKDPESARPYFRRLRELSKLYGLRELSMGMTQDFEVAIEEGATMVRIGSAIFKNIVTKF